MLQLCKIKAEKCSPGETAGGATAACMQCGWDGAFFWGVGGGGGSRAKIKSMPKNSREI